ncbi:von Willebrand factor A domain-containing protein 5A-like [Phaenicophaeus curvirostris]|uniref:von Willebrand factor A domain-containing protein 5A-like n=1 Tax=Phaenicophaeus curvirostris TaxID=33595 RepID=UPI0037F0F0E4
MLHQSFGLLKKSYSDDTRASFLLGKQLHVPLCSVPLCSVAVDVAIQDYVADVASELIYQNKSEISKEVIFVFPLGSHMAIYSFQACSEDAEVQVLLQDETQRLHEATEAWDDLQCLKNQSEHSGELFACSLGTLPPGREVVVTLRYVQELSRELDGAARFVLPPTLHPHMIHYVFDCFVDKPSYSLLLTVSLQSARGVADVRANFALTPLIYTAQDHSAAQVSLAGSPPRNEDLELRVYFGEPSAVSAVLEKGDPEAPAGSLLSDPMVLVMLAPSIPEAVPGQRQSGEFIFLLDTAVLEQSQDTLLFLLKSLPLGCYFNIYCYEATSEGIYPQSVEYTQDNLSEAMRRLPSSGSSVGDTALLGTLRSIYSSRRPRGHARQLFIFMARLPRDEEAIMAEVCRHRNSHRCFSFFSKDSAALATALAKETGGEAAYVPSDSIMTVAVLQCLKRALTPAAVGVTLNWTLPHGLEAEVLGGTPEAIFQGQHSFLYVQIHGQAQDTVLAKGVMTLQYSLEGQDVTHTIEFPLCPHGDGRLAGHRLAMRRLLEQLLPEAASGSGDEPRHRAVEISLASGIICPFTSYVGVRTARRASWYQGPLALLPPRSSLIPCQVIELQGGSKVSSCFIQNTLWVPPGWLRAVRASRLALRRLTQNVAALPQSGASSKASKPPPPSISSLKSVHPMELCLRNPDFVLLSTKDIAECRELVALQNIDGSWALSSGLARVLEVNEAEITGKMPGEVTEPSVWATVLAVTWLRRHDKSYRNFCELLEAKAVTWLRSRAMSQLEKCLEAAHSLLGSSVKPSVSRLRVKYTPCPTDQQRLQS